RVRGALAPPARAIARPPRSFRTASAPIDVERPEYGGARGAVLGIRAPRSSSACSGRARRDHRHRPLLRPRLARRIGVLDRHVVLERVLGRVVALRDGAAREGLEVGETGVAPPPRLLL